MDRTLSRTRPLTGPPPDRPLRGGRSAALAVVVAVLLMPVLLGVTHGPRPPGDVAASTPPSAGLHTFACPGPLSMNVSATPPTGPAPLTTVLRANVTGGCPPYQASWEAGDTFEAEGLNVTHTFSGAGRYPVEVHAHDSVGANVSGYLTVVVTSGGGSVVVSVGASPQQGPAPLAVTFWGNVSGGNLSGAISINWTFGDGGNGAGPVISHVYSSTGTFIARAIAMSNGQSVGTGSASVSVQPGGPPALANLTIQATPNRGEAPLNVTISAYSNGAQGPSDLEVCTGDTLGCDLMASGWSGVVPFVFGHNYTIPGNYTLSATLVDPNGTVLVGASASVDVTPYIPLQVATTADPTIGSSPLVVTFSATVSGGTAPYLIQWLFGDGSVGSTISGQPVAHTYDGGGTYLAQVSVTDVNNHTFARNASAIQVHATRISGPSGLPGSTGGLPTVDLVVLGVSGGLIVAFVLGPYLARNRQQLRLRLQGEALARRMEQEK